MSWFNLLDLFPILIVVVLFSVETETGGCNDLMYLRISQFNKKKILAQIFRATSFHILLDLHFTFEKTKKSTFEHIIINAFLRHRSKTGMQNCILYYIQYYVWLASCHV